MLEDYMLNVKKKIPSSKQPAVGIINDHLIYI